MLRVLRYASIALAGGLAGAVAGVLLAPASGRETRRRLAWRLEKGREDLTRRGARVRQRLSEERGFASVA